MVNTCKSSINVVKHNKPKDADRLAPKGKWSGTGAVNLFPVPWTAEPPVNRGNLTHPVMTILNTVSPLFLS